MAKATRLAALALGVFTFVSTGAHAGGVAGISLPVLPQLPLLSGGGGPGGGGGFGGGPGFGGGAIGGTPGMPSTVGQGAIILNAPSLSENRGPEGKWGDPLSTDLFGNDRVRAHLTYYGQSGATGTLQTVGIGITIPN